jgi:hypothetical protein
MIKICISCGAELVFSGVRGIRSVVLCVCFLDRCLLPFNYHVCIVSGSIGVLVFVLLSTYYGIRWIRFLFNKSLKIPKW